jgi:hypothetical protein
MKYLKEIMIVSMILFLIFSFGTNENIVNNNETEDNTDTTENSIDDTVENSSDDTRKRNKTIIDHNNEHDAIKNLNNFFPSDKKGLIYPEFPIDITNFKILPEDKTETEIQTSTVKVNIETVINPRVSHDSTDRIESLKKTWVDRGGEEESNAILSITKNNNVIQDGVDLKYISGCTEIVSGEGPGTGGCFNEGDIDSCHNSSSANCVWDIICEQPHRPLDEKTKIYTPQECIDRGGIVRTDILQSIKNKTKLSDDKFDIYSVFDKDEGKSTYSYLKRLFGSMDFGKNPTDSCRLISPAEDDGFNYETSLDPSCQSNLGSLFDINIFSDLVSTNKDDYISKIENGIMKKDNKYDTPTDISNWANSQSSCLWSSRLNYTQYNRCSTDNIYTNTANIDWEYYKDLNNKEYVTYNTSYFDTDNIFSSIKSIGRKLYGFISDTTVTTDTHPWENNITCEEWGNNIVECNIDEKKKNNIIGNFNHVDVKCCSPEYSSNLSEINAKLKSSLLNISTEDTWSKVDEYYKSQDINAHLCVIGYEIKTDDLDKIIKKESLENEGEIFQFNIILKDFNMNIRSETELMTQDIITELICGDNYKSDTTLKFSFILSHVNDELELNIKSFKKDLKISDNSIKISNITTTNDTDPVNTTISLSFNINDLLNDIANRLKIATNILSFENIIMKILLLKTKDINDLLFVHKAENPTDKTLKLNTTIPVLGVKGNIDADLSQKLCDTDSNIGGEYNTNFSSVLQSLSSLYPSNNLIRFDSSSKKIIITENFSQCTNIPDDFNGKKLLKRIYNFLMIMNSNTSSIIDCNLESEFEKSDIQEFSGLLHDVFGNLTDIIFRNPEDNTEEYLFRNVTYNIILDN